MPTHLIWPIRVRLSSPPSGPARDATRTVAKQRIMPLTYRRVLGGGTEDDERRFLDGIAQRLGRETTAIPIGRARAGIYLLVRHAVRGQRRRVLMSPFTIPDIVTMVLLAGAEPVFYDFEPSSTACSLDSLRSLIDERTACVLITHYHVNEPRLTHIAGICRKHGAYLFDDCALSFGGSIDGRPAGTLTDASVFSLSSFKLLNYFWGGLVTTRDAEIARAMAQTVEAWPRLAARDYTAPAHTCIRYDLASSPPLFNALTFPLIRRMVRRSPAAGGLEHIRIETGELDRTLTSRPSLAAFAEWAPKLACIDNWVAQRLGVAQIYRRRLGHRMVSAEAPEAVIVGSCFTNFPVIVPRERRRDIARAMTLAGYDVGRSLYPNVHRHPKFTPVDGQSSNIDSMANSTIYLPTHFGVPGSYAEAISERLEAEIGE
jgi:dTDP-4-amino-4,6-dideoxygalactose transaminase